MPTTYPPGSRFRPTRLGLVQLHLTHKVENKVEKGVTGFIKTLNVYGDAPWLLDRDMNPLYCRNEWYYFLPRTVRGAKTVNRMVPGNGENFLGGTWKSTGTREDIMNSAKELVGYRRVLVFNKNVVGKSDKEKTDWHMDEYSLHRNGDEYHDLVLCHIRLHSDERFRPHVPAPHQADENNVLQNQEQQEAGFDMPEYERGHVNQEQEEEQEDLLIPVRRPIQSNYTQGNYLLEAIAYQNDRGYINQLQQDQEGSLNLQHPPLHRNDNQEHYPLEDYAYHGAEDDMTGYELMPIFNEVYQQHEQQQEDSSTLLLPPLQSNDYQEHHPLEDIDFDDVDDNDMFDIDDLLGPLPPLLQSNDDDNNNIALPNQEQLEAGFANHNDMSMMVEKEHGDTKQVEQEDLLNSLVPPPIQSNDDNQGNYPSRDDGSSFCGAEGDSITHNPDGSLTQQRLQELEIFIEKLNLSF